MRAEIISVSFNADVLNMLDVMRGDVGRSKFLQNLVTHAWKQNDIPKEGNTGLVLENRFIE